MSSMISLSLTPIGTSISPVLLILPVKANALVPELFAVPRETNQSAPFSIMLGTFANVSTLFRSVGLPQRPRSTVLGGLTLGMPRLPSIDS